eukprot:CAMPEP_0172453554 /NCGR_PEP_ID=MMETSP1065-20121228/10818_1 /TAXON_ID=265537 /ORGANISM="Amphiprora paludosa, Strain CCMP125" /LENGTH=431 /DNA_ID=CAMNT_0013205737 /DNA_START=109 /DNA_END=1404 /DNA_ORIENTATION=+
MMDEKETFTVLAMYKFFSLPSTMDDFKRRLEDYLRPRNARGLLLLAADEGVNGTISYPTNFDEEIQSFLKEIFLDDGDRDHQSEEDQYKQLRFSVSYSSCHVFHRFKIKIRKEIVSMGVPLKEIIPQFGKNDDGIKSVGNDNNSNSMVEPPDDDALPQNASCSSQICCGVGKYVKPGSEWHALLQDPNCLVIDTRNDYEVALGTFRNAINPHTTSFTEFPEWFDRRREDQLDTGKESPSENSSALSPSSETTSPATPEIPCDSSQSKEQAKFSRVAMFCTGGVRCEKASAYCVANLPKGVPVYHLEGGILAYLKQVPKEDSLWDGECYVFDQRIAVSHGLKPSEQYSSSCHACRHPLSQADVASKHYVHGVACPYCCDDPDKQQKRQRYEARQKQIELSNERHTVHIHDPKEYRPQKEMVKEKNNLESLHT